MSFSEIATKALQYLYFKNALIIHKENTKEITTVAVVLYVIKPHVYFPKTSVLNFSAYKTSILKVFS